MPPRRPLLFVSSGPGQGTPERWPEATDPVVAYAGSGPPPGALSARTALSPSPANFGLVGRGVGRGAVGSGGAWVGIEGGGRPPQAGYLLMDPTSRPGYSVLSLLHPMVLIQSQSSGLSGKCTL